ncbi:MAG: protein translocase subunit SecD, partial [Opitutales bacterium]|nr:protein translocase subunit SecD [Opitutales bacterium]
KEADTQVKKGVDASSYLALLRMGRESNTYYFDGELSVQPEDSKATIEEFPLSQIEKRDDGKWYQIGEKEPLDKAKTKGIDFVEFFPKVKASYAGIKNRDKRNEALLSELFKLSRGRIRLGLDLKGGIAYTLKLDEGDAENQMQYAKPEDQLADVIKIMRKRLDGLGVAEPVIRARGNDMIEIQLPGLNSRDNPEAINDLKKPAKLDFRKVHRDTPTSITGVSDNLPAGYVYLRNEVTDPDTGETSDVWYPVEKRPYAAGDILTQADATLHASGFGYKVSLNFTSEGGKKFAAITGQIADENPSGGSPGQLAIVLDGEIRSAPTVRQKINGNAEISGSFTQQEAVELANVLNNPLSVELQLGEKYEVSPTLAKDSQEKSINAAKWGAILIVAFMIVYYFAGGLVAVVSVALNILLVLGAMASLGATMTLPGVAALVLTVGMAVDANILIFERIREELALGKSLKNALEDGYNKAFSTIIDANLTTLITAIILYFLGTGPVRGFGLTLAIGIVASVFCALIVSRLLLEISVHWVGLPKILGLKLIPDNRKWKFLDMRKPLMVGSAILIVLGMVNTGINKDNIIGIDFTGGDEITIEVTGEASLPTEQDIHAIRDGSNEINNAQVFYINDLSGGNQQLKIQTDSDKGALIFQLLKEQRKDLEMVGETQIGGAVSKDIQRNAWLAVGFALIGILLYVAFRFELGYGVGAVVATVHDVLITIGMFVVCGNLGLCSGQFTAPMLAALLMILGYSINDTIVLFDRIREELRLKPDLSLLRIINFSVNRVLPRTILTSVTTLLAALSLYIFGAGIIKDFSFVFVLGILTGTYSSIFIASPIFYWWHKGDRKHVEQRELLPKYEWNEES